MFIIAESDCYHTIACLTRHLGGAGRAFAAVLGRRLTAHKMKHALSDRLGAGFDHQGIYRVPAEGGAAAAAAAAAEQVTKGGGFAPVASADGQYLYYAKGNDQPGIWRVSVAGGDEVQVVKNLKKGLWGYWALSDHGIYYVDLPEENSVKGATLQFCKFSTGRTSLITVLDKIPNRGDSGLALSFDGQSFLYAQADRSEDDIILVEDYH